MKRTKIDIALVRCAASVVGEERVETVYCTVVGVGRLVVRIILNGV